MDEKVCRPVGDWDSLLDDLDFLAPDYEWPEEEKRKVLKDTSDVRCELEKWKGD